MSLSPQIWKISKEMFLVIALKQLSSTRANSERYLHFVTVDVVVCLYFVINLNPGLLKKSVIFVPKLIFCNNFEIEPPFLTKHLIYKIVAVLCRFFFFF